MVSKLSSLDGPDAGKPTTSAPSREADDRAVALGTGTLGGVIPSHFRVRIPGLRATREARGLSRTQLALMTATTPAELAAIEEGVQTATDDELRRRLLRALAADWDELFEVVGVDRFGRISPLKKR